jgi:hypothetical protein
MHDWLCRWLLVKGLVTEGLLRWWLLEGWEKGQTLSIWCHVIAALVSHGGIARSFVSSSFIVYGVLHPVRFTMGISGCFFLLVCFIVVQSQISNHRFICVRYKTAATLSAVGHVFIHCSL